MQRAISLLSHAMIALAGVGIVSMLLFVVADVTARVVFNTALPGTDTIVASYLMVATIFLPLALLQLRDENIAVDALRDVVPDLVKDVFDIIGHLLTLAFYCLLGWLYFKVAIDSFRVREFVTGTWDVPIWPARVIMPLGLGLGAAAAALKLACAVRAMATGEKAPSHDTTEAV